jgi:GT2 family glycosyltransferase
VSLFATDPTLVLVSGPYRFYDASLRHQYLSAFYWRAAAILARVTGVMAVGGNMVIRKDALHSIGGFDTRLTFYGDDTDIARRLRRVGRTVFRTNLWLFSSARRLKKHGLLISGFLYVINYFSELIFHRPATKTHENIRT